MGTPVAVQQMMRHAEIRTTFNIHGDVVTDEMTTATSKVAQPTVGGSVTFRATVVPAGPPVPTGTVTFTSNGKTISGCAAVMVTSSRTAACTTTSLTAGTDTIKASYSGNSDYTGSSGSVTQTVNQAASTTTVVSSKNFMDDLCSTVAEIKARCRA